MGEFKIVGVLDCSIDDIKEVFDVYFATTINNKSEAILKTEIIKVANVDVRFSTDLSHMFTKINILMEDYINPIERLVIINSIVKRVKSGKFSWLKPIRL
jgi:hypothetical protein